MKFRFLSALFLVLIAFSAAHAKDAVTRISADTINSDTVWSGKVVVEKPLTVTKAATLTIKPGTEVSFKKDAGLTVEGTIKAAGKKGALVVFTSGEAVPAAGDWAGITLSEAGPGSTLKYCSISYAAAGVSMDVCSVPVQNCEFKKGVQGIVLARKAKPRLEGNLISGMTQGGINCQMGTSPTITGNTVERCGSNGITSSKDALPTIKGNTVTGCENGISVSQVIPPVENNTVKENKTGIFITNAGSLLAVRGNRITANEAGIICQQISEPIIEKNEIYANTKEGVVCYRASSPLIRNNNIFKNEQGVVCVQLCNPRVSSNNIYENKKGVYLDLSSYAVITSNNIYSNDVQMELGNMSSDWENRVKGKPSRGMEQQKLAKISRGKMFQQGGGDGARIMGYVDARGNWWGDAATAEMEQKGPEANIKALTDYYDMPTRTYEGYTGVYTQDKIKYEGWKKTRIKTAGY